MVRPCPCLLLVTLSAARTNPESHSGSVLQEVAWEVGGRLDITHSKVGVIELIAAAEWLCLSNSIA